MTASGLSSVLGIIGGLLIGLGVGHRSGRLHGSRELAGDQPIEGEKIVQLYGRRKGSPYTGPWLVGQRAEYTDESLPGVVLHTYNDGVNKVVFAPDRGGAFPCSDDHLVGETSGAEGCQP